MVYLDTDTVENHLFRVIYRHYILRGIRYRDIEKYIGENEFYRVIQGAFRPN